MSANLDCGRLHWFVREYDNLGDRLEVSYRVISDGWPGREVRELGSDIWEWEPGEAPTIEVVGISILDFRNRQWPRSLESFSPDEMGCIIDDILEQIESEWITEGD